MTKTENYVRELYFIFFRQKRLIFWVTTIIFVIALLIAFLWPPVYSATGDILVRGKKLEKSPQAIENEESRTPVIAKEDLSSEEKILISPNVIELTLKDLMARNQYKQVTGKNFIREVYDVQSSIKTELVPASNILEITYLSKNPQDAMVLLQALMDQYMEYRTQVYNPPQARGFFSDNAEKYSRLLAGKEAELLNIVKGSSVADPRNELMNNLSVKKDIQLQLNTYLNEFIERQQSVQHLEAMLADKSKPLFSYLESMPAFSELSKKMQDLIIERGKVLRAFTPESDKVTLVTKHIDDTYNLLHAEVRGYLSHEQSRLQIVQDKIKSLQERSAAIDQQNVSIREQMLAEAKIERDMETFRSSFTAFSKRREEAITVREENMPSQVSIVKKAFPGNGPVFPKKRTVVPLGLLVGFVTGFSLGFLREYFDHTFKKPSDVEHYTAMPVIFSIPYKGE